MNNLLIHLQGVPTYVHTTYIHHVFCSGGFAHLLTSFFPEYYGYVCVPLFYALELAQSESEVILAVKRLVGYLGLKESKQNATGRCARHT